MYFHYLYHSLNFDIALTDVRFQNQVRLATRAMTVVDNWRTPCSLLAQTFQSEDTTSGRRLVLFRRPFARAVLKIADAIPPSQVAQTEVVPLGRRFGKPPSRNACLLRGPSQVDPSVNGPVKQSATGCLPACRLRGA